MKQVAGLWIDHREAVIVILSDTGQKTRRVKSRVEKQLRRSGRSPSEAPFEAQWFQQMIPGNENTRAIWRVTTTKSFPAFARPKRFCYLAPARRRAS